MRFKKIVLSIVYTTVYYFRKLAELYLKIIKIYVNNKTLLIWITDPQSTEPEYLILADFIGQNHSIKCSELNLL